MPSTPESLQKFVRYCQQHLKGDEKGESQNFLDRFFQAFGHEGAIEAGATLEQRVKKGSKKGNTGFADLAWKPHLLVEMKKRLFKLHAKLDTIVLQAHSFKPDDDLLEKLLTLNLELAEKEKNGEVVPSELRSALIVGSWAPIS